jgi:DNA relaxase NicK
LENHLFYTRPLEAIKNQLEEVTELMGLSFKNFNRLDVALDFQEDTHNVNDLLRSICANEVLISGREKDINIYSQTKKGKMSFQGIRIGARTSSRFLRIYNKTLESKKVLKTYINEAWLSLGFDSTEVNPVWRYEYQLSSKYLRDVEGLTLDVVFSNDGLFNLLKAANTNHFDLKHNTNKSEVNKERTYSFLCWSAVSASVGVVFKVLKKLKRTIKETLIGQQRMAKSLLRSYFSTGQRLEYILPLKLMLNDFDLWQWFGTKLPFYIDEFKKAQLFKTLDMSQLRNDLQYQIWEYEN